MVSMQADEDTLGQVVPQVYVHGGMSGVDGVSGHAGLVSGIGKRCAWAG